MTTWNPRANELFLKALERPSQEERGRFLDDECAAEPALRAEVEALLEASARAGAFLESPAHPPQAAHDQPLGERPGTVIGPYKLLERLGEGGMGTVWMAQQSAPVKRLVAIKLVKVGMDSRQVIARFEAERQALALLDHPNIARVLDGGTTSAGRPYFVMDLVKGVPITAYCDEHHLTPRERLELFVPVCQAVQHAHQKGIIHRDLKPSNILVALYDGKPVPKVIDFGVAKAAGQPLTEQTLVTGFGNILGTLEYMSPEQAELNQLDIDTRTDIYSLGVILYELLTGSPPFTRRELEKAGMLDMLRVIREQEPFKPSTRLSTAEALPTLAAKRATEPAKLTRLLRGELDWIVMKALEKDRNRRYETANNFAMDVQRYLADEPVQACPPSARYRFSKFARRNKGGLAVATLVLFFLVLLGSGIGWAVRDRGARQARVAGQVELIIAEVNRQEEEQKWPEALAAARRAEAAANGGEADTATKQHVRALLKDLELIDRLEQIRMQRTALVQETGKFDHARANRDYTQAFRDYGVDVEKLPVEASIARLKAVPALALPLAAALDDWVNARWMVSEKHAKDWNRPAAVARGIDPDPVRDQLRSAWGQTITPELQAKLRRLAASIEIRAQHPATLLSLARTLQQVKAGTGFQLLRDAQAVYPGDFWLNYELGHLLNEQGDYLGATRYYTAAVALRPQSAAAHHNLGGALVARSKPEEAIASFRNAAAADPKQAVVQFNLGNLLRKQKKLTEAIAAFREAIALDPNFSQAYYSLGNALYAQKNPAEGARALREGLEHDDGLQRLLAHDSNPAEEEEMRSVIGFGAPRLLLVGDTDVYVRLCRRMAGSFEGTGDPHTDYLVARICALAPGAVPDATRLVHLAEKAVRAEPKPHYLHALGLACYRAGRFDEAIGHLRRSIAGNWNANAANWLVLAMAHQRLGHADEARQWYDQAVEWMENPDTDALNWLHGHDSLACLILRREAGAQLGLAPGVTSEDKKSPGEGK